MTLNWARPNQAGKAASGKPQTRARRSMATATGRRHRLLPVLHAIQNRIGWISPGALNYVALRLDVAPAEVHGVASFYGMFSLQPRPPVVAHVCDDIACFTRGSDKLCAELERHAWSRRFTLLRWTRHLASQPMSGSVRARSRGADQLGRREISLNECWRRLQRKPCSLWWMMLSRSTARRAGRTERSSQCSPGRAENGILSVTASPSHQPKVALQPWKPIKELGGYEGLRKALELGPEGTLRELSASKLLGRGGAAFPTAKKWEALFQQRHLLRARSWPRALRHLQRR